MLEIKIAEKLNKIIDPKSKKDIVSSGILKGINIYNKKINFTIDYDDNEFFTIEQLKEKINSFLRN